MALRPRILVMLMGLSATAVVASGAKLSVPGKGPVVVTGSLNGRSAQVNYMTGCQGCHMPDGHGISGRVPALKGHIYRFLTVDGGRAYLVRVPGSANSKLSDTDLSAVLNWLIPTMGGPSTGAFEPYTPDEVARYRRNRLIDVVAERNALIAKMPAASVATN